MNLYCIALFTRLYIRRFYFIMISKSIIYFGNDNDFIKSDAKIITLTCGKDFRELLAIVCSF